jgi:hypothetical protein
MRPVTRVGRTPRVARHGCYDPAGMTRLDWLKVVGWYVVAVAMMQVIGVAAGSAPFGGPLSTGAVVVPPMVATNVAIRTHGRARPIPRHLLASVIGVIASLQAVMLAIGQATVGWQLGWQGNAAFAAFSAIVYPLAIAWLHRRQAGTSGLAADADR